MVPLIEQFIPKDHPNRPGTPLESLKAIVFHYTANDAPTATDTVNAKYFARPYVKVGNDFFEQDGKTPFRYGSTQVLVDIDSITFALPLTEAAWSAGGRDMPWTPEFKGQQPVAKRIFNNRQNYQNISIEICNNDVIKNSTEDWDKAADNAAEWVVSYIKEKGLKIHWHGTFSPQDPVLFPSLAPNEIILLRHYDLTGKKCPLPFIDNEIWGDFIIKKIVTRI